MLTLKKATETLAYYFWTCISKIMMANYDGRAGASDNIHALSFLEPCVTLGKLLLRVWRK